MENNQKKVLDQESVGYVLLNTIFRDVSAVLIKEDGTELTRSFHRHVLAPSTKTGDTWGNTDISGEETRVQAICNAVWTNAVKTAYQVAEDATE